MTPLNLSRSQQLYVFITVLIVLPLLVGFAFQNELYALYLIRFRGPELQREFGFTAGIVQLATATGERHDVFAITSVVSGGPFARSGFQAGDIPTGYKHGFANGFYQDLIWAKKGESAVISVIAAEEYSKDFRAWRKREVKVEPLPQR